MDSSNYVAYRKTTNALLSCAGLLPNVNASLFYSILPHIHIFFNLATSLAVGTFVWANISNVTMVTKGLSTLNGFLTGLIKVVIMVIHKSQLGKINRRLDYSFNQILNHPQSSTDVNVLSKIDIFYRLTQFLICSLFLTCGLYIIIPMILIIFQLTEQKRPIKYILPLPTSYPWHVTRNGLLYKLHYLLESLGLISVFVISCAFDCGFSFYIFEMMGIFREMSRLFMESKNNYPQTIRKCMVQYDTLKQCQKIIEKAFGPAVLWMFATNAIALCSLIYQFINMNIFTGKGLLVFNFICFKILQTFLYGFSGSCITIEVKYLTCTLKTFTSKMVDLS